MAALSKLCEKCKSIASSLDNIRHLTIEDRLLIPWSLKTIKASQGGCVFCRYICDQLANERKIREHFEQNPGADDGFHLSVKGWYDKKYNPAKNFKEIPPECADLEALYVHAVFDELNYWSRIDTFDVYTERDDLAAAYISRRPPNDDLESGQSYDTINQWLHECLTDHPECPTASTTLLPTRVLDVGTVTDPDHVYLYISGDGEMGQYAALSYCWGGPQPVTATTRTIETYKQSIDMRLLPKTITDAIKVTRKLQIKYLWIDALCILQDSDNDKGREIDNMKNIYRNAYFTISAASTKTCHDGFLQPRIRNPQPRQFKLPYACPNGTIGTIILYTPNHFIRPNDEPLNKRGWTLQERLLSPRLLIYGVTDLYWECQTKHASNGGKGGVVATGIRVLKDSRTAEDSAETLDIRRWWRQENWMEILEDYSTRELTVAEDKLTAISSIVEAHVLDNDVYYAGLWKSWLLNGLMWFAVHGSNPDPPWQSLPVRARPETYIAPSWSWASVNCPITHASKRHYKGIQGVAPELKVMHCEVTPALFNRVSWGALALGGFIKPAMWDVQAGKLTDPGKGGRVIAKEVMQDAIEADEDYSSPIHVWCLRMRLNQGMILKMRPHPQIGYTRRGWFRFDEHSWYDGCETKAIIIF